jgi:hypothetical protein
MLERPGLGESFGKGGLPRPFEKRRKDEGSASPTKILTEFYKTI